MDNPARSWFTYPFRQTGDRPLCIFASGSADRQKGSIMRVPLGYERMTELAAAVRSDPWHFDMRFWHGMPECTDVGDGYPLDHEFGHDHAWPCGTTHCIGGLAQARFCPKLRTLTRIMEALDLPPEPPYTRMFFLSLWPSDLRQEHDRANQPELRSEAAAKVVERYRDMRWPEVASARISE